MHRKLHNAIHLFSLSSALILSLTIAGDTYGAAKEFAPLVEGLGTHSYPLENCKTETQAFFDQGLRLYYGFRFPESLASFRQASKIDPQCAMAAWGEALAIGPNPNSRYLRFPDDPKGEGSSAIKRAMSLGNSAAEKHLKLIEALDLRYRGHADRAQRDSLYSQAMANLAETHAKDAEILTLYTEALMTQSAWAYWTPDGKPRPGTEAALNALNAALVIDPGHPGANHLFIHLLEDSLTPERALPHAERLADSMPNVGHMVHMPTHIYIRTGHYQKAIDLNVRSIEAANTFLAAWGEHSSPMGVPSLSSSDRNHVSHATDFMHLAAILQGNFSSAMDYAKQLSAPTAKKLNAFGGFQRRYVKPILTLRRFARWQSLLSEPLDDSLPPLVYGFQLFTHGSALVHTGDVANAQATLGKLFSVLEKPETKKQRSWVNNVNVLLRTASHVLAAEIAVAKIQYQRAIAEYEDAIRLEDGLNYMEPPEWGHPVRQELGALLLSLNRPAEAETVFWEDLRRNPENGWSLHGVWQSLLAQGKTLQASQVKQRFITAWQSSDTKLFNGRAVN